MRESQRRRQSTGAARLGRGRRGGGGAGSETGAGRGITSPAASSLASLGSAATLAVRFTNADVRAQAELNAKVQEQLRSQHVHDGVKSRHELGTSMPMALPLPRHSPTLLRDSKPAQELFGRNSPFQGNRAIQATTLGGSSQGAAAFRRGRRKAYRIGHNGTTFLHKINANATGHGVGVGGRAAGLGHCFGGEGYPSGGAGGGGRRGGGGSGGSGGGVGSSGDAGIGGHEPHVSVVVTGLSMLSAAAAHEGSQESWDVRSGPVAFGSPARARRAAGLTADGEDLGESSSRRSAGRGNECSSQPPPSVERYLKFVIPTAAGPEEMAAAEAAQALEVRVEDEVGDHPSAENSTPIMMSSLQVKRQHVNVEQEQKRERDAGNNAERKKTRQRQWRAQQGKQKKERSASSPSACEANASATRAAAAAAANPPRKRQRTSSAAASLPSSTTASRQRERQRQRKRPGTASKSAKAKAAAAAAASGQLRRTLSARVLASKKSEREFALLASQRRAANRKKAAQKAARHVKARQAALVRASSSGSGREGDATGVEIVIGSAKKRPRTSGSGSVARASASGTPSALAASVGLAWAVDGAGSHLSGAVPGHNAQPCRCKKSRCLKLCRF